MPEMIANLDDARLRTKLANRINELRGMYRIEVTRYRKRRSDRQNRYYWPCFVVPFGEFLREHGNEYTDLEVHEILKHKFLRKTADIRGEKVDITRSTTRLDTAEFNEYLDKCAAWLSEFGIYVPDPDEYRETHTP